jgi:hypothetical protein
VTSELGWLEPRRIVSCRRHYRHCRHNHRCCVMVLAFPQSVRLWFDDAPMKQKRAKSGRRKHSIRCCCCCCCCLVSGSVYCSRRHGVRLIIPDLLYPYDVAFHDPVPKIHIVRHSANVSFICFSRSSPTSSSLSYPLPVYPCKGRCCGPGELGPKPVPTTENQEWR